MGNGDEEGLELRLRGFNGTERYHRLTLGDLLCTDGVRYLAEEAGCFWLIEAIASYQAGLAGEVPFQAWELVVQGSSGVLSMRADSGCPVLVEQRIGYTDFPMDSVKLWLINGVLMLPSEY